MLLYEGLTHIQSQIKPRLLLGESFTLSYCKYYLLLLCNIKIYHRGENKGATAVLWRVIYNIECCYWVKSWQVMNLNVWWRSMTQTLHKQWTDWVQEVITLFDIWYETSIVTQRPPVDTYRLDKCLLFTFYFSHELVLFTFRLACKQAASEGAKLQFSCKPHNWIRWITVCDVSSISGTS